MLSRGRAPYGFSPASSSQFARAVCSSSYVQLKIWLSLNRPDTNALNGVPERCSVHDRVIWSNATSVFVVSTPSWASSMTSRSHSKSAMCLSFLWTPPKYCEPLRSWRETNSTIRGSSLLSFVRCLRHCSRVMHERDASEGDSETNLYVVWCPIKRVKSSKHELAIAGRLVTMSTF